jgi:predicted dehydrogenase
MKFLIVGLGSMGKRRIRNLQDLEAGEIVGLEPNEERRKQVEKEYDIKTVGTIGDGFAANPDAVIISTPPDVHGKYALMAAEHGKPFFIEASVVLENDIVKANEVAKKKKIVAMPSCTMRFNWRMRKIKELVDGGSVGKVVAVNYHMGQWLPDWHKYEDIRKFYVGKKETGAGREMVPFEMEWISWIFGPVRSISCIKGKFSDLPIDIDDVYSLNMKLGDRTIANILIDVISRSAVRRMEIVGDKGTIIMDWNDEKISIYDAETKKWSEVREDEDHPQCGYWAKDDMYIEEMRHFISVMLGKTKLVYTMDDDIRNLTLLLDAEKSSDSGRRISAE